MSRKLAEIKAAMKDLPGNTRLIDELEHAITNGIPLDRLETICNAERDGRCVVLPESSLKIKDHVKKISGSEWHGTIVGFYSTHLTPIGFAVESNREKGSVQIYPEAALRKEQKDVNCE